MIRQTVLPTKLENTKDTITPHAGLALMGEFCGSRQDMALKSGPDDPLEVISGSRQDCVSRGPSFSESKNRI